MSPSPQLAPPGSSSYTSDTMHVGDGTWDASRNDFLLPNLQGLNFDTMRYNGMGNRFASLAGYHSLIRGHGIVAAITFLGVVPCAIVVARFYHRNPRLALRLHVWLQILTLLLTTVVFVLGWFAVGIPRSLTNPHHGIGLALYVLVWFQIVGGALIHRVEKKKVRYRIPLKLYLHQWLGRAIALLGMAQIALGLTLYGSPRTLFVLFALAAFAWLSLYFVLSFRNRPTIGGDDAATYISGARSEVADDRREHRHRGLKALATAGAAGAGIEALRRRSRSRRREQEYRRDDVISSRHGSPHRHSESFVDEKFGDPKHDGKQHTWRSRILGAAAGAGGLAALRSYFDKRKDRGRESDVGSYSHPYGGAQTVSQTDVSRVEEGRPPESPADQRTWRHGQRDSVQYNTTSPVRPDPARRGSDDLSGSYVSQSDYGLRDGIAALGVGGFLGHKWARFRHKEDNRVSRVARHDRSEERLARLHSQRERQRPTRHPVAQGYARPGARRNSLTSSAGITGSNPQLSRHTLPPARPGLASIPTGPIPPLDRRANVVDHGYRPAAGAPPPPPNTVAPPPGPPDPVSGLPQPGGGGAAWAPYPTRNDARDGDGRDDRAAGAPLASPPVSVKVRMHTDGRHVTLRRLDEAEAAAERDARRRERRNGRAGSLSSVDGGAGAGDERWRRAEALEARQAREMLQQQQQQQQQGMQQGMQGGGGYAGGYGAASAAQPPPMPPPPPPPIPGAASGLAGSPGAAGSPAYDTGTDVSNYDSNRRRRRAERAQAKARGAAGGRNVEFT